MGGEAHRYHLRRDGMQSISTEGGVGRQSVITQGGVRERERERERERDYCYAGRSGRWLQW